MTVYRSVLYTYVRFELTIHSTGVPDVRKLELGLIISTDKADSNEPHSECCFLSIVLVLAVYKATSSQGRMVPQLAYSSCRGKARLKVKSGHEGSRSTCW